MIVRTLGITALVMLLASAAIGAGDGDAQAALEQREQAFREAMAARDAVAVSALFAETAVLQVAGMPPVNGRENIQRFYDNLFGFLIASEMQPERTRVAASGDMAYSVGRTANAFAGSEGSSQYEGKYLLVWKNGEAGWLISAYSVSSNHRENRH